MVEQTMVWRTYHWVVGSNFSPLMMWLWAVQTESPSLLDLPRLKGTWREENPHRAPRPASVIDNCELAASLFCELGPKLFEFFFQWDSFWDSSFSASDASRFSSDPRFDGTMAASSPQIRRLLPFLEGVSTVITTSDIFWRCSWFEDEEESESQVSTFFGSEKE